ncbi:MAG: DUF429 domain-containing protein [Caldilineaceae bacterium]
MVTITGQRAEALAPTFVGIDLAWSRRNPSGGAVLRDGRLVAAHACLTDDDSILAFLKAQIPAQSPCVVAVDAPLRVPNMTGRRDCDAQVSAAFWRHEAGALPANRSLALFQPEPRGELLVRRLADELAILETMEVARNDPRRLVCEVYPHPAHIVLFGLEKTIKYKKKRGRTAKELEDALSRYRGLLATLATADPPLAGLDEFAPEEPQSLHGKTRKAFEDRLDAITCAYVAAWAWTHGPTAMQAFGSPEGGSILVPRKLVTASV